MPVNRSVSTSQNTLRVLIMTSDSLIFEGEVFAVSGYNDKGPFDILPQHKNFISQIFGDVHILYRDGKRQTIPIQRGILRVYQNRTDVYLIPQSSTAG